MTTISDGGITAPAGMRVIPRSLENSKGCFEISRMSACLVIAQNGSKPGGTKYATGSSDRRRVHSSCGYPWSA